MIKITWDEVVLNRLVNLSPFMPHYWSELFVWTLQFLEDSELLELQMRIREVELLVYDQAQVDKGYSLYDIEMQFESIQDYNAYFELEDGTQVTKLDIERKLDKVRQWLFLRIRDKASKKRYTRLR